MDTYVMSKKRAKKAERKDTYSELLYVVLGAIIKIVSHVEDIISEGAHALGAVNVAVGGIAHAAAGLAGIPR